MIKKVLHFPLKLCREIHGEFLEKWADENNTHFDDYLVFEILNGNITDIYTLTSIYGLHLIYRRNDGKLIFPSIIKPIPLNLVVRNNDTLGLNIHHLKFGVIQEFHGNTVWMTVDD